MIRNMKKPKLVVVLGNSRSGKDTVAKILHKKLGYKRFHVLESYYEYLEKYFDIPEGSIIDGSGKEFVMPGTEDVTLHEFLVDFYHMTKNKNIKWTLPALKKLTENLISNTVIPGIRNLHEMELLILNSNKYELILVEVKRDNSVRKTSDKLLDEIKSKIAPYCNKKFTFNNNSTKEDLEKRFLRQFNVL